MIFIVLASEMLKGMNRNVDPCDNFYEFVCGNFIKETVIPDDKVSTFIQKLVSTSFTINYKVFFVSYKKEIKNISLLVKISLLTLLKHYS